MKGFESGLVLKQRLQEIACCQRNLVPRARFTLIWQSGFWVRECTPLPLYSRATHKHWNLTLHGTSFFTQIFVSFSISMPVKISDAHFATPRAFFEVVHRFLMSPGLPSSSGCAWFLFQYKHYQHFLLLGNINQPRSQGLSSSRQKR